MATVTVERLVNAPLPAVWASWDDFGGIYRFNPNIRGSFLLEGSKATGLGATRQCDLTDGKNYIQERIVDYVPKQRLVIDIFNGTLPIKNAMVEFDLHVEDDDSTRVRTTMHFEPKQGILGRLMLPLMKPQLKKMLGKLLDGNAAYVENDRALAA